MVIIMMVGALMDVQCTSTLFPSAVSLSDMSNIIVDVVPREDLQGGEGIEDLGEQIVKTTQEVAIKPDMQPKPLPNLTYGTMEQNLSNSTSKLVSTLNDSSQASPNGANTSMYFKCVTKIPREKGKLADHVRLFMLEKVNKIQEVALLEIMKIPGVETISLGPLVVRAENIRIAKRRFNVSIPRIPQLQNWTYADTEAWKLNGAWSCKGSRQSPINIITSSLATSPSSGKNPLGSRVKYNPLTGRVTIPVDTQTLIFSKSSI